MSQSVKMFKDQVKIDSDKEYYDYIQNSLKPLGFGENSDTMFYKIKRNLFETIYQECKTSGASFDAEILFTSIISDLNETFDIINPILLKMQRVKDEEN